MANTEVSLENLTINELSRAKFEALSTSNQLEKNQLYMIKDDGVELIYKGAFATLTQYYINNVVKSNGGYYICKAVVDATNTAQPADDESHWEVLVPSFKDTLTVGSVDGGKRAVLSTDNLSMYKYTNGELSGGIRLDQHGFLYFPTADQQYDIKLPSKAGILAVASDIPTIVYSDTEPSSPTEGMIWLKPVQ